MFIVYNTNNNICINYYRAQKMFYYGWIMLQILFWTSEDSIMIKTENLKNKLCKNCYRMPKKFFPNKGRYTII